MNPTSDTSSTSLLAQLLQDGTGQADQQIQKPYDGTNESFIFGQSNILARAIADGIARIGAEYSLDPLDSNGANVTVCRNQWCSNGPYHIGPLGPEIFNGTSSDWPEYASELSYGNSGVSDYQFLHSYREPNDIATSWTRITFPIKNYGYAWSLEPTTVKIATAILMLHTLIIIIHCCYLILTGRCYSFASSLGDLLALALNSRQPDAFKSASVAIGRSTSWSRPISVRESQGREKDTVDRLELIADAHGVKSVEDASLHRRPVAGKRYQ